MASRPVGDASRATGDPSRPTGLRTRAGLPAASLACLVGIVLVVNAHLYGWPGVAGGIALTAAGVALGVYCFRPPRTNTTRTNTNGAAAAGRPASGEQPE